MNKNHILFVFEGADTEFKVTSSLGKYFINENILIRTAYCNTIYELYEEIKDDPDLDTFLLLKNIPKNADTLKGFRSSNFSEIYIFFDFDGQANKADDNKIEAMINHFSNETEKGKLFISYPMIEAIKHIPKKSSFQSLIVPARKNIYYKQMVAKDIDEYLKNFDLYSRDTWQYLIESHLRKMNFIVEGTYKIPERIIGQLEIFQQQKIKYIDTCLTVAVLSAFPPFILEYYGIRFIKKLTS